MWKHLIMALAVFGPLTAGLWNMNGGMLLLGLPALVFVTVGYFRRPARIALSARRTISASRVNHGETVHVLVTVINNGSLLEEIAFEDMAPSRFQLVAGHSRILTTLATGESASWEYDIRAVRGEHTFGGVRAVVRTHAGLFEKQMVVSEPTPLSVMPCTTTLKKVVIRPRRTQKYAGPIPTSAGGSGIDFHGIREYAAGDPLRLINWKALARHPETLFTNEFEQERIANVGIIFDCRINSYTVGDKVDFLDLVAPAAVDLADALLKEGNRVGLLVYGAHLEQIFMGSGKIHRERILQAIYKIKFREVSVFENLNYIPKRLFPFQTQLIFFSPLIKADQEYLIRLKASGFDMTVISPNPLAFELGEIEADENTRLAAHILQLERDLVFHELDHSGIRVIDWDVKTPFHHLIHRHFNRIPKQVSVP